MVIFHRGSHRDRWGIVPRHGVVDHYLMVVAVFVQYARQDDILASRPVLRIEGKRTGHGNPRFVPAFRRHGHRPGRLCRQTHLISLVLQDSRDIQTLIHDHIGVREDECRIVVGDSDRYGARARHVAVSRDRVAHRSHVYRAVVVLHASDGDAQPRIPVRRIQRERSGHRRDRLIIALRCHGHGAARLRCQLYGVGGGTTFSNRHRLPIEQHCWRPIVVRHGDEDRVCRDNVTVARDRV